MSENRPWKYLSSSLSRFWARKPVSDPVFFVDRLPSPGLKSRRRRRRHDRGWDPDRRPSQYSQASRWNQLAHRAPFASSSPSQSDRDSKERWFFPRCWARPICWRSLRLWDLLAGRPCGRQCRWMCRSQVSSVFVPAIRWVWCRHEDHYASRHADFLQSQEARVVSAFKKLKKINILPNLK